MACFVVEKREDGKMECCDFVRMGEIRKGINFLATVRSVIINNPFHLITNSSAFLFHIFTTFPLAITILLP